MFIGIGMDITGGGLVPFDPISAGDMAVWLDASISSSVIHSAGAVSEWSDLSGSGNDVLQATAFNKPVTNSRTQNGLNVIDFDGASGYMQSALYGVELTQPNTVFIVGARDVTTADNYFVDGLGGAKRHAVLVNGATKYQMFSGAGLVSATNVDILPHVHTVVFNAGTSTYHVDGASVIAGVDGAQAMDGLSVGAAGGVFGLLNGWIGEIRIYNELLSAETIALTESSLTVKWGI